MVDQEVSKPSKKHDGRIIAGGIAMLSSQARIFYKFIISQLQGFKDEIDDLLQFTDSMKKQQKLLVSTILNNQGGTTSHSTTRIQAVATYMETYNNGIASFKNNFRSIDFAIKYKELEKRVIDYLKEEQIISPEIDDLFNMFNDFIEKVQVFQQKDNDATVRIALYAVATDICTGYYKLIDSYSWFIKNLEEHTYVEEKNRVLLEIMLLGVNFGVNEFSEKINAINEMYDHISAIVPIGEDDEIEPMQIVKIESGSLDFSVICNDVVGGLIVSIISGIAVAMINWFKSKKDVLPKKNQEAIVREKLKENGVDEDNTNREHIGIIQKRAIELTSKFITIKINNESYSYERNDIRALPFNQKLIESSENTAYSPDE